MLVIGGGPSSVNQSVEFWSPTSPEQRGCVLGEYPREMMFGPTVNLAFGRLVACYEDSCDVFQNGIWQHLMDTHQRRVGHSSATTEEGVLLIGGQYSNSTELISVDDSPVRPGPFVVRHGHLHCTVKVSTNILVVTGGIDTYDLVTEYHLNDNQEVQHATLQQGRRSHACGVYQNAINQQVGNVKSH